MTAIRPMLSQTPVWTTGVDDSGLGITIPFTFWVDDQVYISSNGFVVFGAAAVAYNRPSRYAIDLDNVRYKGIFCTADLDTRDTTIGSRVVHGPVSGGYAVLWENMGTYNRIYGWSSTFQICMFPDGRGELNVGSITQINQAIWAGWRTTTELIGTGTSFKITGSSNTTPSPLRDGGANALVSGSYNSTTLGRYSTAVEAIPVYGTSTAPNVRSSFTRSA